MRPPDSGWWAYVLVTAGRRGVPRTYVGITDDLDRRLAQHNGELPGGAKATRAHRPWVFGATVGCFATRGEAASAEYRIKKMRGSERVQAVEASAVSMRRGRATRAQHRAFRAAAPADERCGFRRRLGALALVVHGNLAATLWGSTAAVRLSPRDWVKVVRLGGHPFVPLGRTLMKDMIIVPERTWRDPVLRAAWMRAAVGFASGLPPQ